MFRFENIDILYLLFVIPLLFAGYFFYRSNFRKRLKMFGTEAVVYQLMPLYSSARPLLKFTVLMLVLALMIFALARPQFGSKLKEVKREGIEMIIALDVSNSMLATDIKPNRLERAKQAINTLISKMKNDRIGLIIFAGDAYTQLPITTDYTSAKMFLANTGPDVVSKQGTAIGKAIKLGVRSFTQDEEASKVIVIISDGENHEGDALESARMAAEKGISIYTIGMGSPNGSLIPLRNGRGFVTDRQGNPVTSRMNPEMLNKIAVEGGGKYYTASSTNVGLNRLYSELQKLDKAEIDKQVYSEYDDQYAYFISIALILIIFELLLHNRKNKRLSNLKLFS